jgi:hypothetical protein
MPRKFIILEFSVTLKANLQNWKNYRGELTILKLLTDW